MLSDIDLHKIKRAIREEVLDELSSVKAQMTLVSKRFNDIEKTTLDKVRKHEEEIVELRQQIKNLEKRLS